MRKTILLAVATIAVVLIAAAPALAQYATYDEIAS